MKEAAFSHAETNDKKLRVMISSIVIGQYTYAGLELATRSSPTRLIAMATHKPYLSPRLF